MDYTSRDLPSRPEQVPNLKQEGLHENEDHTRRKRKRKRKKSSNITKEAFNVAINEDEDDEPAAAQDSFPGLSSTQDLLGEPGKMLRTLLLSPLVEAPLDRLSIFPMAIIRNARTDSKRNRTYPVVTACKIRTRRKSAALAESRINHRQR